jgi:phosphatidylserine decarboxylase
MTERMLAIGDHILSPANGTIIEIRETTSPDIVFEKKGIINHVSIQELTGAVHVVMIEMNLSNIHVQRAPITGIIMHSEHFDGKHKNALGKHELEIAEENEKVVTVFGNDAERVGVVQVAGMVARRIRTMFEVGDPINQGEIYGKILFGSQVVVLIPAVRKMQVSVGDVVIDGETILAK